MESTLIVNINSFSYRRGIPVDDTGHGGGFVFDCRAIHNPGKYERYVNLTGLDVPVIEFFSGEPDMAAFLEDAQSLVDRAIRAYLDRGFTSLMVNFGCTGGQHRSVYSAEAMRQHLMAAALGSRVALSVRHREQEFRSSQGAARASGMEHTNNEHS